MRLFILLLFKLIGSLLYYSQIKIKKENYINLHETFTVRKQFVSLASVDKVRCQFPLRASRFKKIHGLEIQNF